MKTFLIGVLWVGISFLVGVMVAVALHHFRRRDRRNFGFLKNCPGECCDDPSRYMLAPECEKPRFKTSGMNFVCCEHDADCERRGVPCKD